MDISASVGRGGVNVRGDVVEVQSLVNRHLPFGKRIEVDGIVGPRTISAIEYFQKSALKMKRPDAVVDPRGPTLTALLGQRQVVSSLPSGIKFAVGRDCPNIRADVVLVQALLNRHFRSGQQLVIDGVVGRQTLSAIEGFQKTAVQMARPDGRVDPDGPTFEMLLKNPSLLSPKTRSEPTTEVVKIAWGKRVSGKFKRKVIEIAGRLGLSPDHLMACMAFETGETFSPSIKNGAGSGATGLIQFMPATAKSLGTSTQALAAMTAEDQLDYVERYFHPYKGRLQTLEDIYLAILYPAAIGMDPAGALFRKGTKVYKQNNGFDRDRDGAITPAEISIKVRQKYTKGLQPPYFG